MGEDRREFLSRLASLLAGSAVVGATAGCTSTGTSTRQIRDMGAFLAGFDAFKQKFVEANYQNIRAQDRGLFNELLSGVLFIGAYQELTPKEREEPVFQSRLATEQVRIAKTVFKIVTMLEDVSKTECKKIQQALKTEPELLRFEELVIRKANELGMPLKHTSKINKDLGRILWRLKNQNVSTLFKSLVEKVDRMAKSQGLTPQDRRDLVKLYKAQKSDSSFDEAAFFKKLSQGNNKDDVLVAMANASKNSAANTGKKVAVAPGRRAKGKAVKKKVYHRPFTIREKHHVRRIQSGQSMMGTGGLLMGIGILSGFALAPIFLCCLGGIVFLVGLVMLIVGATSAG